MPQAQVVKHGLRSAESRPSRARNRSSASDLNLISFLEGITDTRMRRGTRIPAWCEVGAFYWTVLVPDIVNPGREEQGSVSV
jgi:hypothetical protein